MRKKRSWLLVFGLLIGIGFGAYRIDQHKKEKESFVDLAGSFQQIEFPKDILSFYEDEQKYEYISQSEFVSSSGNYELSGQTVYFHEGALDGYRASVKEEKLIVENMKDGIFEKKSQIPLSIGFEEEHGVLQ